jgi:hypothetical protein
MKLQETIYDARWNDAMERLDALAAKAGVAVEHLWGVFVQQSFLEGITQGGGLFALFAMCFVTMLVTLTRRLRGKTLWWTGPDGEDEPQAEGAIGIISIVFSVILGGVFLSKVDIFATKIFNPEYYAWLEIRRILE